jgi:hypothetical protein
MQNSCFYHFSRELDRKLKISKSQIFGVQLDNNP